MLFEACYTQFFGLYYSRTVLRAGQTNRLLGFGVRLLVSDSIHSLNVRIPESKTSRSLTGDTLPCSLCYQVSCISQVDNKRAILTVVLSG